MQKNITLAELSALLKREHGALFAISTVHRLLVRYRITLEKSGARCQAVQAGHGTQAAGLVRRIA